MNKTAITKFLILTIILTAALSVNYLFAAWTGPTEAPPGGNTPTPVHVGLTTQTKEGGFIAGGLRSLTDLYVDGNVGIGTVSPVQKLDVTGNIQASGTVCDSNGCIGSGGVLSNNSTSKIIGAPVATDQIIHSFATDKRSVLIATAYLSATGDVNSSGTTWYYKRDVYHKPFGGPIAGGHTAGSFNVNVSITTQEGASGYTSCSTDGANFKTSYGGIHMSTTCILELNPGGVLTNYDVQASIYNNSTSGVKTNRAVIQELKQSYILLEY